MVVEAVGEKFGFEFGTVLHVICGLTCRCTCTCRCICICNCICIMSHPQTQKALSAPNPRRCPRSRSRSCARSGEPSWTEPGLVDAQNPGAPQALHTMRAVIVHLSLVSVIMSCWDIERIVYVVDAQTLALPVFLGTPKEHTRRHPTKHDVRNPPLTTMQDIVVCFCLCGRWGP